MILQLEPFWNSFAVPSKRRERSKSRRRGREWDKAARSWFPGPSPSALPLLCLGGALPPRRSRCPSPPAPRFSLPLPVYKEETYLAPISNVVSQPLTLFSLTCRQTFSFEGSLVLIFNGYEVHKYSFSVLIY